MAGNRRPFGANRRALAAAVRVAEWLEPKGADGAALQLARDLADRLDVMRRDPSLFGDSREAWHLSNLAAKYLAVLVELQLTPERRPELEGESESLVATLRAVVAGDDQ
jgi:hypothetical protein